MSIPTLVATILEMLPHCPPHLQDVGRLVIKDHQYPDGTISKEGLDCPSCGKLASPGTQYIEDCGIGRRLDSVKDGIVYIDGFYSAEGFDEASDNGRLSCLYCHTEFKIPASMEVEFQ